MRSLSVGECHLNRELTGAIPSRKPASSASANTETTADEAPEGVDAVEVSGRKVVPGGPDDGEIVAAAPQ
jgi:hypothetical protein